MASVSSSNSAPSPFLKLNTSFSALSDPSHRETQRSPRTPVYFPTSPSSNSQYEFDPVSILGGSPLKPPIGSFATKPSSLPPRPDSPLAWVWTCHLCHSRYPLGATRRCLVDGHYYCSGDSGRTSVRRKRKTKACSSEFDYVAWREWGEWRSTVIGLCNAKAQSSENSRSSKGCENCVFPSQCRYPPDPNSTYGVVDPDLTLMSTDMVNPVVEGPVTAASSRADDICVTGKMVQKSYRDTNVGVDATSRIANDKQNSSRKEVAELYVPTTRTELNTVIHHIMGREVEDTKLAVSGGAGQGDNVDSGSDVKIKEE